MRALAVTSSVSAATAQWIEAIRAAGHDLEVFDAERSQWVSRTSSTPVRAVPGWLDAHALRSAGNAVAGFYQKLIDSDYYDAVVGFGLAAGGVLGRFSPMPFSSVLFTGNLDFSSARTLPTEDFDALTRSAPGIFLEDSYEFDKALSKGSRSSHMLLPVVGADRAEPILADDVDSPRVALLHPERMAADRVEAWAAAVEPRIAGRGGTLETRSVSSVFRHRDAMVRRQLGPTLRTRLGQFSHVLVVGSSIDHRPVIDALLASGAGSRILVEETIAESLQAPRRLRAAHARGGRFVEAVDSLLDGSLAPVRDDTVAVPGGDPLSELLRRTPAVGAPLTEEIDSPAPGQAFDVFFSATPLDDSTAGARPQRIRNIEQAFRTRGPLVRVPSSPAGLARRAAHVRALLAKGCVPGVLYGENSTSPLPLDSAVDELTALIGDFSAAGGSSGWFVRDLHWLDPHGADYIDDPEKHEEMVRRGLAELLSVGGASDVLFAPSEASIGLFRALLEGRTSPVTPWAALPPGVAAANCVSGEAAGAAGTTTLLYAGGLGSFYAMDSYLSAVAALDADGLRFDFVVRAAEADRLISMLADHGLGEDSRVRILTSDLDVYVPSAEKTIGIALLDSDYARLAFPYKTVSFIEKGFPVLAYADMGIASFVSETGVGEVCERTPESIGDALERMLAGDYRAAIDAARVSESWEARVETARDAAAAHKR